MESNDTCVPNDPERCPKEGISDQYWIYLMASGIFLVIVYVLVARPVISHKLFKRPLVPKRYAKFVKISYTNDYLKFAKEVAMGRHISGNIITIISLAINLAYFGLYWRRTVLLPDICLYQFDPEWKLELGYTIYFVLYFCWRAFGGYDDLTFWLRITTIADLVTIPHIFVSLARGRDWLGLRFLRIMWFNHIFDLLIHLPPSLKFALLEAVLGLLTFVITFWLTCSGAIHLLEVTGDPWQGFNNRHCDMAFQDYIYFIIVTISSVGYGDIAPRTESGRLFIILLIILSIVLVTYLVSAVAEIFSYWSRYSGSYLRISDVKHVIVTGYITPESVKNFLRSFLHPDWDDDYTRVLLLHPQEPDYALYLTFKNIHSVKYFKGSVLNSRDMERVNMDTASAVIILSPNYSQNPESEDESNMMRIVSIKNAYNNVKVIAQVFQLQSLQQVLSLSHWDSSRDVIICKNKLKFGLMAQNCLCPGISTLLSNLVYPITDRDLVTSLQWQSEYGIGAENEVYRKPLPDSFIGKTYEYIAKLCFVRYELLFIAVDCYSQDAQKYVTFLSPFGCNLKSGLYGYFIAKNNKTVLNGLNFIDAKFLSTADSTRAEQTCDVIQLSNMEVQDPLPPQLTTNHNPFYYCTGRDFQSALTVQVTVKDHIILCTFNLKESDRLSLYSFVSPLRACSLKEDELKPIVIIGNKECIRRMWSQISNFQDIFVIDGNPLDTGILTNANVAQCSCCVVLGSTASLDEDPALIDKQPILCSLTLTAKGIKFSKSINRTTELYKEENVRFLDLSDKDNGKSFVTSHTYAQGDCISGSIFDALVAVTYFNPGVTALFEMLVTSENDLITCSNRVLSCRPQFLQISLQEENYKRFGGLNFSELFAYLLEERMLCIGISRVMDNQTSSCQETKRYVITSPHNLQLTLDDIIFVLISK